MAGSRTARQITVVYEPILVDPQIGSIGDPYAFVPCVLNLIVVDIDVAHPGGRDVDAITGSRLVGAIAVKDATSYSSVGRRDDDDVGIRPIGKAQVRTVNAL